LRDDKLLAEFEALPFYISDIDISDGESESEVNDSDSDKNDPPQGAVQRTKRRQAANPLFQWLRGNFVPQNKDFDDENSGISANLDENCTVFHVLKLFSFCFKLCSTWLNKLTATIISLSETDRKSVV
jgi:hypothetical protein